MIPAGRVRVMNMLLLSINNTRTRLALAEETPAQVVRDLWVGPSRDFGPVVFTETLAAHGLESARQGLVLSCVVPAVEASLQTVLAEFRRVRVSASITLNFSLENYAGRATLGADRIADLAAVADRFALPAVILDLGTAVTVDVLDANRRYLGGMIAPGLRLFTEYLGERTAQLPRLQTSELSNAPPALGQDTREAITSGAFHGFAGQCRGLLEAAVRALPEGGVQSIIVTGGDAAVFHSSLALPGTDLRYVPDLGLTGMRLLGRLNIPTS